jgi:hypothetical protein
LSSNESAQLVRAVAAQGPVLELLIDLEEDKAARVVVFGLLAEMDR